MVVIDRNEIAEEAASMIGVDAWIHVSGRVIMLAARGCITGDEMQNVANQIWERRKKIIEHRLMATGAMCHVEGID